jgi:threonyl-tRNA synthetase
MKKNRLGKKRTFGVEYNNPKSGSSGGTLKIKKKEVKKMSAREEKSEWLIALPDGSIVEANKFDWKEHSDLRDFYRYESAGSREAKQAPVHVKMMQQLELVDYEPAADPGNFRWLPKGHLIKRLMEEYVSRIVRDYGGMQVETPIMYNLNHPQLSRYLERFPARQYQLLSGKKKYFLRFAACFGQYLIMHDMQISYQHLPIRLYELTHYSFRRELTGELAGLRRLRGFTMPDMHTLCVDIEQAKTEFYQQYLLCKKWMKDLELNHVMAIRVVEDFFEQNRDFVLGIVKDFSQPVLLERWKKRFFYFILKFEFNVVDSQKKAAALSTVQIDVENAERFGIRYIDKEGKPQYPLLLHASMSGSIDRNLYALLEQEARRIQDGKIPKFPYWLSPVQVRLIPVADRHLQRCLEVASQFQARVEIDDRTETVPKKIREAEINWVPFIGVIGDKEIANGKISIRERGISEQKEMEIKELKARLNQLQGDKPFEPINWPNLLSKQPRFH